MSSQNQVIRDERPLLFLKRDPLELISQGWRHPADALYDPDCLPKNDSS